MSGDRIEDALRTPGPRERRAILQPLPRDVRAAKARLQRIDRRRGLRTLAGGAVGTLAAAAAVVAVAMAAGGLAPTPGVAPGTGVSLTPAPSAAATAPAVGAGACLPSDLRAVAVPWGAAAGSRGTTVTVTNIGSVPCGLDGRPGATIAGETGIVVSAAPSPERAVLILQPGASVTTSVVWSNWCGSVPSGSLSVSLTLSTGTLAVTPDPSSPRVLVPPCMGTAPTSLDTNDFQRP